MDELVFLARRVREICLRDGLRIATAESCTGGLVSHALTEVPGSSGCFAGGVVAYSDDVKRALLDVPAEVIAAHGAVSAQVARAMATGVRRRLAVDVAVAVTGIAGPDGGTDAKPVGLTYIAVADARGVDVQRYLWTGDRQANKQSSAAAALGLLVNRLGTGTG